MTTALIPFDQLQGMAKAIAQSGLFGMKTQEQALALMLTAQAEGQHPATITQDYDIIQGRAARKTHSVLARFQAAGGKVEWHELTGEKAIATFSHPSGGSLKMDWTLAMAQKIGLTGKDNWKNYPRAMLRARLIAEGVRAVFPAAIGGMLVAEEAQDFEPRDVTAEGQALGPTPPQIEGPKAKTEPPAQQPAPPLSSGDATSGSAPRGAEPSGAAGAAGSNGAKPISPGAVRMLKSKMTRSSKTDADLHAKFGFANAEAVTTDSINTVMRWAEQPAGA